MSDPTPQEDLHDAFHRMTLREPVLSNEDWRHHGYSQALLDVMIGSIDACVDVRAELDAAYRALADTGEIESTAIGKLPDVYWEDECRTCKRTWPSEQPERHADDCVYVKAVDYVANNPKETPS